MFGMRSHRAVLTLMPGSRNCLPIWDQASKQIDPQVVQAFLEILTESETTLSEENLATIPHQISLCLES